MIFKHIDTESDAKKKQVINGVEKTEIEWVDEYIKEGKYVFILIFMTGCGPCESTKPEWNKIKGTLEKQYANRDDVVVIDVNKNYLPEMKLIGSVNGFPTMKYIKDGKISDYDKGSRDVDSFVSWIESKIIDTISSPEILSSRITPYYNDDSDYYDYENQGRGVKKSKTKTKTKSKGKKSKTKSKTKTKSKGKKSKTKKKTNKK